MLDHVRSCSYLPWGMTPILDSQTDWNSPNHLIVQRKNGCLFDVCSMFQAHSSGGLEHEWMIFSSSLCEFTRGYLVGGDWNHGIWIDFPYFSIGNVIIPTDFHSIIFQSSNPRHPTFTTTALWWRRWGWLFPKDGTEKWDFPGEII